MNKLFIFLFIALMACSPKIVTFTQSDVERASAKFPGTTEASLIEGRTHYQTNCATCHLLKSPTSHSEEGWRNWVPKMVVKANEKAGKIIIDPKMEESILAYLVTMTTAPSK